MEKRKEAGCALAASLLAGALALPTAALEVSQAWGVEPEAAKDEVVYVKAGADGATQGLYVVNVFDTGSVQTVDDPARYTRVKNLTTTDALVQENGAVQVSTCARRSSRVQATTTALPSARVGFPAASPRWG